MDLSIGWQFDLALLALATCALLGWRWLTYGRYERWHRRMVERHFAAVEDRQHLAESQRPHEGDWDWPSR